MGKVTVLQQQIAQSIIDWTNVYKRSNINGIKTNIVLSLLNLLIPGFWEAITKRRFSRRLRDTRWWVQELSVKYIHMQPVKHQACGHICLPRGSCECQSLDYTNFNRNTNMWNTNVWNTNVWYKVQRPKRNKETKNKFQNTSGSMTFHLENRKTKNGSKNCFFISMFVPKTPDWIRRFTEEINVVVSFVSFLS